MFTLRVFARPQGLDEVHNWCGMGSKQGTTHS